MKTTIEIPDALAREAKAVAQRRGTTLRDLVVAGLRSEIERREASVSVDFHFPTVPGEGLVADLEPGQAVDRSYGFSS
jgi:hypothetical protein